jgi:hypothetical protein
MLNRIHNTAMHVHNRAPHANLHAESANCMQTLIMFRNTGGQKNGSKIKKIHFTIRDHYYHQGLSLAKL